MKKRILPVLFCCVLIAALSVQSCAYRETRAGLSMKELRTEGNIQQVHEYTCGAASIATLMTSMGEPTTESEVLAAIFGDTLPMRSNDKGELELAPLTVANLQDAAKAKGFKVVGLQALSGEEAIKALQMLKPAITRLYLYSDFLHFVVVRDIDNGWVYVSDPGYGNYRIPVSQFYKAWESGDRILLTVSKKKFLGWQTEDGRMLVKRDPSEKVPTIEVVAPVPLYTGTIKDMAFATSSF